MNKYEMFKQDGGFYSSENCANLEHGTRHKVSE